MTREQLKINYEHTSNEMKNDFVEWITICNYMDEQDFNNLFKLSEISENDFFRIINFLWKQECFYILFMIIAHHINRFEHKDWVYSDEINPWMISRINRLNTFKDFKIPKII